MTRAEQDALVVAVTRALEQRGVTREGEEWKFQCFSPEKHRHGDAHWSARWNASKAVWHCDVCDAGGGVLDLAKHLHVPLPVDEDRQPPRLEDFARERSLRL